MVFTIILGVSTNRNKCVGRCITDCSDCQYNVNCIADYRWIRLGHLTNQGSKKHVLSSR